MGELERISEHAATLGEGPCWHTQAQLFYWVDIESNIVHVHDPGTGSNRAIDVGQRVGTVAPRASGGLIVALENGIGALDLESGELEIFHDPEPDKPNNRFNDGKCDPAGRFWAGTMPKSARVPSGALYCMERDLSVRKVLDGVGVSNGLAWSADHETMYYIDTPTRHVRAFDYDIETGEIANPRKVIEFGEGRGYPDGMTIDTEGMLWVAEWLGWRVGRWDPASGELLEEIRLPAAKVTAPAFGGPDLDDLYITTASIDLSEEEKAEQPDAGGLFRVKTGHRGLGAYEFAG